MTRPAPTHVRGAQWMPNGQTILSGSALEYLGSLDDHVVRFASGLGAGSFNFPPFILAAELDRGGYLESFPQLATFAANLDGAEANLAQFVAGPRLDRSGALRLTALAPSSDVLTPAACYHLYVHHQGARFDGPRWFTTRSTCFRREEHYVPLERQWSFTMREVVCAGTPEQIRDFLESAREFVDRTADQLRVRTAWETASDPFFGGLRNPHYLMQQVDPTKRELVFEGRLALASLNLHHTHFGEAYDIRRLVPGGSEPVTTACVAFGWERWLSALGRVHGGDPETWPRVGAQR